MKRACLAGAMLLCGALAHSETTIALPFAGKTWELAGDAKIENYLGRQALRARNGGAVAAGVSFRDGTIDLDMAAGTHRNFSMVYLRRQGDGEYEEFYFRTHKSELPDAVQYAPAWQGVGGWQIFHGPGFTASATFPRDQWVPLRIVLSGDRAAVFVGSGVQPRLVSRLRREPKAGTVGLWALLLADSPDEAKTSFSNVVLRPGYVPFDFSNAKIVERRPPGVVRAWEVSEPFSPPDGEVRALPPAVGWRTVAAEPSGLVAAERFLKRPSGAHRAAALARLRIDAATEGTREFRFGFSDEVTVFLNGRPIFSGDARYSFDDPRQEGLIGLWQGLVYLPLRKGSNDLVLAVADSFGGWGWMGQFADSGGLEISPRESDVAGPEPGR